MSNSKHTPGPWELYPVRFPNWSNMIIGNGKYIAVASMSKAKSFDRVTEYEYLHNERNADEVKANAKLIAAAPDLLESLADVLENIMTDFPDDDPRKLKYQAAIKKATD